MTAAIFPLLRVACVHAQQRTAPFGRMSLQCCDMSGFGVCGGILKCSPSTAAVSLYLRPAPKSPSVQTFALCCTPEHPGQQKCREHLIRVRLRGHRRTPHARQSLPEVPSEPSSALPQTLCS
eukprot:3937721-Rhodomonas_salina.2